MTTIITQKLTMTSSKATVGFCALLRKRIPDALASQSVEMGQAESTTLTRRATTTSTKIASEVDIEASSCHYVLRVFFCPQDDESVPSYFSATMIVVDDQDKAETLTCVLPCRLCEFVQMIHRPITSFVEGAEEGEATGGVSNAFYCVQKGQCFWIKCNLLRPTPPGISFGARVYVDSGATNFGAYTRAGSAKGDCMVSVWSRSQDVSPSFCITLRVSLTRPNSITTSGLSTFLPVSRNTDVPLQVRTERDRVHRQGVLSRQRDVISIYFRFDENGSPGLLRQSRRGKRSTPLY